MQLGITEAITLIVTYARNQGKLAFYGARRARGGSDNSNQAGQLREIFFKVDHKLSNNFVIRSLSQAFFIQPQELKLIFFQVQTIGYRHSNTPKVFLQFNIQTLVFGEHSEQKLTSLSTQSSFSRTITILAHLNQSAPRIFTYGCSLVSLGFSLHNFQISSGDHFGFFFSFFPVSDISFF